MTGLGTWICNVAPYRPLILLSRQQRKHVALIVYRHVPNDITLHARKNFNQN